MATRFDELEAKYMFEVLGYEYFYWKGDNEEDSIHYTLKNKNKIQFNVDSKTIVIADLGHSEKLYIVPTIFIDTRLQQAINKQIEELRWYE